MSGAVGSIPSFTRSGRPSPSLRSRPPSGRASTTFRSRNEAPFGRLSVMVAMLEPRARRTGPRAPPDIPDSRRRRGGTATPRGSLLGMESAPIPLRPPRSRRRPPAPQPQRPSSENGSEPADNGAGPKKPKVKKLRLALVLLGLGALAFISTIFGMMMAVANELPQLEAKAQLRSAVNSTLYSATGEQIAKLTGNENRIVNADSEISPNIKNAVIAIEDKRFYEHQGVDLRGMSRAFFADITSGSPSQGASTITQQFVKNALVAQNDRTVFEKLREAALAYHLEHRWSKQKILDNYLNTIYFGNGAYGVESAVRTYFGGRDRVYGQQERVARDVPVAKAAMLAAMIASPSAYDPIQNPIDARKRRDMVLRNMLDQKMISPTEYETAIQDAIPVRKDLSTPHPDSTQPYFSSWVTQQLVERYGAGAVFGGGMKVTSSIDPELQRSAEEAINGRLSGVGPSSALVAIENKTGEVKAMVGGDDFEHRPFNLATNGHRQPGSAIKPFILATALSRGISPNSLWSSRQKIFPVPHSRGREKFVVNNFGGEYAGTTTLSNALVHSDNSVFAELGLKIGTRNV